MDDLENFIPYTKPHKKIICLNTGEIFENSNECAKRFNTSIHRITSNCRDKDGTYILNGLQFAYEGSNKKFVESVNCSPVYCFELERTFFNVYEVKKEFNLSMSRIIECCKNKGHISLKGSCVRFCFLKDKEEIKKEIIEKLKIGGAI